MGRPPKGIPKGIPSALEKLTDRQAEILVWVFQLGLGEPVLWSPKAYLGRSPTQSEAATLSSRVKSLVEQGALSRVGRDIGLTSNGRALLYAYTMKNRDKPGLQAVSLRLEAERIKEDLAAVTGVKAASFRHLGPGPETEIIVEALNSLTTAIAQRMLELHKQVVELTENSRD
jgi:hypothetical protein